MLEKKRMCMVITTVASAFMVAAGSLSLAADKSDGTATGMESDQSIEAFTAGEMIYGIPELVCNRAGEAIAQAQRQYEEEVKKAQKAAEEAEKAQKAAEEAEKAQKAEEEAEKAAEEAEKAAEEAEQVAVQSPIDGVSASEEELLAALIFCEAGNQPYEGQVAVGAVVMNRVRSGVYPNSISEVVYQSGQFTPAMTGWLDCVLADGAYTESAMQAAMDALSGSNPIGDMLYFDCGGFGYQIGDHFFH